MEIETTQLVDALSDTVGEQKAEHVITDAAARAGVDGRRALSEEEALDVLSEVPDDADSLVQISASTVQTQIKTGNLS